MKGEEEGEERYRARGEMKNGGRKNGEEWRGLGKTNVL